MKNILFAVFCASALIFTTGISAKSKHPSTERLKQAGLDVTSCTWSAIKITAPGSLLKATAKNKVPRLCFRTEFELKSKPRLAKFTVQIKCEPGNPVVLYINGKIVPDAFPECYMKYPGILTFHRGIESYLRKGKNVIAAGIGGRQSFRLFFLAAEGVVFCENGDVVNFKSGSDWRVAVNLPSGWEKLSADTGKFGPVRCVGKYKWGSDLPRSNPPYLGRIQVNPVGEKNPIFNAGQPVKLDIKILNLKLTGNKVPGLTCEIMDEASRKTIKSIDVKTESSGKFDFKASVDQKGLPMGTYRFRFALADGKSKLEHRDYEVAVVGKVRQVLVKGESYTEGMKLKKVWSVDCTKKLDPENSVQLWSEKGKRPVKTKVVNGPAGRYREFVNPHTFSNIGFKFTIKNRYKPHLAVIEWPDDAPRQMIAQVIEPTTAFPGGFAAAVTGRFGFTRGEASVICAKDYPRSNKIRKLRFFYWPNEYNETIHIFNYLGKAPAAISKITIYEIESGIPALKIDDAGNRMIGFHTERGPYTMRQTYYSGPLGAYFGTDGGYCADEYYQPWFIAAKHLIEKMRFAGQNVYLMGQFMYIHALYASERYRDDTRKDYGPIVLRMFEQNGLSLISNIEYTFTQDLLAESEASIEEVRKGTPTLFAVTRKGEFCSLFGFGGKVPNHLHPRVKESYFRIVDELLELYKDYPAWKGINFILNGAFAGPLAPMIREDLRGRKLKPLNMGYGDYTINLFEKETGINIPVKNSDPKRFEKRYEWLMKNAKQKWIDWRSKKYTEIYCEIRNRIVAARPDLKLYLCMREPQPGFMKPFLDQLQTKKEMENTLKCFGYNAEVLKKQPDIVTSFIYMTPGTRHGQLADAMVRRGIITRIWRDFAYNQTWNDLFANDGKGGAYIHSCFTEGNKHVKLKKWLWQNTLTRQGYPWAPGRYMLDNFVNVFVRSNPTVVFHTWCDVQEPGGHLGELRWFSKAFRSLPNGKYTRLKGNGLDKNLWVETVRHDGYVYGYVANTQWWPLPGASVTFSDQAKVFDLMEYGKKVNLSKNKWDFDLQPYGMKVFRIKTGNEVSPIVSAKTSIPKIADKTIDTELGKAKAVLGRALARKNELSNLPVWVKVKELEKMITQIETLKSLGNLSKAYRLATCSQFSSIRGNLLHRVLDAIPFLVIGPFGDKKWTNKPPVSYYELKPEYRGMETDYIPENGDIDFTKPVKVYPGVMKKWVKAVKGRLLSWEEANVQGPGKFWMVAYAYTEVYSPEAQSVFLNIGSDHAAWVWLNGRWVLKHGGKGTPRYGQRPAAPGQNKYNVELQKGWNEILIKAVQRGKARIFFSITDKKAKKPLKNLKFRVPDTQK